MEGGSLWLRGAVFSPDGARVLRAERRGPEAQAEAIGRSLAGELLGQGAAGLIAAAGR